MGQVSEYEGVCCRGRQAAKGMDGTLKQNKAPGGRSRPPGHRPFLTRHSYRKFRRPLVLSNSFGQFESTFSNAHVRLQFC